jgi:HAE1 family hydrophobic/amphiphilic exporter-1
MKLDRALPEISLRRPVTVLMLFIALCALGVIALSRIPYEMMPLGFESPYMGFWVPYPNSTPAEVEERIARPFEENLRSVHGLKYMESYSQSHGCWVWMQMRDGTDMDQAWSQVRDRIDRSLAQSTVDIERVVLRRMGMDEEEVYWMGISSSLDPGEARALIEEHLQQPLERLDGVAKVDVWGSDRKDVLIDLDLDAMKRHGFSAWEINSLLGRDNFARSCGLVIEGGRRLSLRVDARWDNLEEVARLPLGMGIVLSDVADVHMGVPEENWAQRIDKQPSLMVGVSRESTANAEELCRRIDETVSRAASGALAEDFQMNTLFSQGRYIRESIDNLKESGLWGGFFALVVLFFFLRRWTSTLVITAAIPFCVFIAITLIYFMGWSLNIITMMGLMISVGMVVDNAIVVMESITISRNGGGDTIAARREGAIAGAAEVSLAVTVATLTSIVVFLPLMLMGGNGGLSFFLMRIGMPVVGSLLASLLVALLFIPQLAARIPLHLEAREPRLVQMGRNHARRLLAFSLKHRGEATLLALLVLFSMSIPMQRVEKSGDGEGNVGDFRIILDMPASYSMDEAGALVDRIEDLLYEKSEIYRLRTVTSRYSNTWGNVHAWLENESRLSWYAYAWRELSIAVGLRERSWLSRDEALEDMRKRLPKVPGVELRMGWNDWSQETGTTILVLGPDTDRLKRLSDEIRRRVDGLENVIDTELDVERGDEELVLRLDRDALGRHGLRASDAAGTVRYALAGNQIGHLRQAERDIPIHLRLAPEDRDQLHELLQLETGNGQLAVPLENLTTVEHGQSLGTIRRSQGKTFMRVKVFDTGQDKEALNGQIRAALDGLNMPPGYSWNLGRSFDRMMEQEAEQQFAMVLAISFVFLLMGVLFESFSIPLVVLAAIPFAFFGAWWALYLTGTPFDLMAGIGLIILVGVVVNNAIVLVDLVVRLRRDGHERRDALLEAISRRYRPVMMTALTTVCGLIPMAIGNAALVGMPYAPMGRAMAGGLITSTFFTLIVVPLLYTWIDDARLLVLSVKRRVLG